MVVCLERNADLHMAQLMPLPLAVSCFSKIQIVFTFLVPAHPGIPGQWAIIWAHVCVGFFNFKLHQSLLCMLSMAVTQSSSGSVAKVMYRYF